MKKNISVLVISMILASTGLMARELRTPWSLDRGYMHAPIPRPTDKDTTWNYDTWAGASHKEANKAFKDKQTFSTDDSLAGIVFGKNSFIGLDAFAPGTIAPSNPFLAFAQITPKFDYRENAAYFGFAIERAFGCDCKWHAGFRASMPFRSIKVELDSGPCCNIEEDLDDVAFVQNERLDDGTGTIRTLQEAFAYRLDFLNALYLQQAGILPFQKFLIFNNPSTINGDPIQLNDASHPVHVIQRDSETKPEGVFSLLDTQVGALPALGGNGSGPGNDQHARFATGVDYSVLGADSAAQRKLFLVPSIELDGTTLRKTNNAIVIYDQIQQLLKTVNQSALEFFEDHDIFFNTQHVVGAGDLNTELYINHEWCDLFVEGIFGAKFPTGVKVKDPGKLLSIFSTGNNRHFETKLGLLGTWQPKVWFIARADAFWSHVFGHDERVGAPFKGSTVKNIGPTVSAHISWDYFQGHIDANFLVPCNPRVGFMFGYEWYVKTSDDIRLNQTTATDFLGSVQPLDSTILEQRTKVISHKVRTEMFHQGDYWELFGGWTHVFAGRNAPQESDWHLGFAAYF